MVILAGGQRVEMSRVHPAGVFAGVVDGPGVPDYPPGNGLSRRGGGVLDDPYR